MLSKGPTGMRTACMLALTAGLLFTGGAALGGPAQTWAWKYRVLVVFAPGASHDLLTEQRRLLKGLNKDLRERHMAVIEVVNGQAEPAFGPVLAVSGKDLKSYARKQDGAFEVMLFGKDTGIKLRSDKPVTANQIFSLIDQMPMRRQEMRAQDG